jgi:hypothetical protein
MQSRAWAWAGILLGVASLAVPVLPGYAAAAPRPRPVVLTVAEHGGQC